MPVETLLVNPRRGPRPAKLRTTKESDMTPDKKTRRRPSTSRRRTKKNPDWMGWAKLLGPALVGGGVAALDHRRPKWWIDLDDTTKGLILVAVAFWARSNQHAELYGGAMALAGVFAGRVAAAKGMFDSAAMATAPAPPLPTEGQLQGLAGFPTLTPEVDMGNVALGDVAAYQPFAGVGDIVGSRPMGDIVGSRPFGGGLGDLVSTTPLAMAG